VNQRGSDVEKSQTFEALSNDLLEKERKTLTGEGNSGIEMYQAKHLRG